MSSEQDPNLNDSRLLGHQLSRRLREAGMVVFIAVGAFMLLALWSYEPGDLSWYEIHFEKQAKNLGGIAGAAFADGAFVLLGYLAYLLPLFMGWAAFRLFRRLDEGLLDPKLLWIRLGGAFLALLSGAALAGLLLVGDGLPEGAGGVTGQIVADYLRGALGFTGAALIAGALFLSGLTLSIGLSWLAVAEWVGKWTISLCRGFWHLVSKKLFAALLGRLRRLREARSGGGLLARDDDSYSRKALPWLSSDRSESADQSGSGEDDLIAEYENAGTPNKSKTARAVSSRQRQDTEAEVITAGSRSTNEGGGAGGKSSKKGKGKKSSAKSSPSPTPAVELLDPPPQNSGGYSQEVLDSMSAMLEQKLLDFGVEVKVESVQPGPVITRFELLPAAGVKVSRISNLAKDLARSMSVISVRVVEVIPGKTTVGLEIPNEKRQIIGLSEMIRAKQFTNSKAALTVALGKDIGGNPVTADLAKMPHLLVAGTTGSGKSVGVNAMILSLLYRNTAERVKLIMVDPKMLELSVYDGIPHLLAPVVTDMNDAANALRWCVAEMERRYRLMAALGVRNLEGFNEKVRKARSAGEPLLDPLFDSKDPNQASLEEEIPQAPELDELPYIVVIVDELADMMMIVGKKVEELIARLAQKARAAGLHLILATQRPSVDVITGLIKANIPTRIAFQVSSRVDSRTILDQQGAEALLGHGDMLYVPPGSGMPQRVHGAFVSDDEVHRVVEHLKQLGEPEYVEGVLSETAETMPIPGIPGEGEGGSRGDAGEADPLYDQAVRVVTETRRASISGVQRRLKIGYNRAARLVEEMEAAGVVGPLQSNGSREVLAPPPPPD
ncbi:cell division protein FtsK [Halorhodospira halochloris]|uniref:DNA translocase FtsK n=1 Tax=Halorhodospira halochloris TaxID=1052 RepID=A0A0X8X8H4_HALHR|nr:DNA translocase FtsK [Halorhodospira halochloris]BAU57517.2 cell division protein FtsK [Halorhodospira halochloris]